jgi:3'(2'), 5'-bisphosphate nucleotidase
MSISTTDLIDLCRIAHQAGRVIMDIYKTDFTTHIKDDASPVTAADQLAETLILDELTRIDKTTPVVGEESTAAGRIPQIGNRFYLVDPLDGTKEFLNRNGEFTVNIGLIEDHVPVAGVIYAPAIGEVFAAANGIAYGGKIAVSEPMTETVWRNLVVAPDTEKTIAIASRSHRDAATEAYLLEKGITEIISAGSSLKFCAIASGRAHVYPRFGRTMEWDTAAGHAILIAAGGNVRGLDGQPLRYGKSDQGFANPSFIASNT